MLAVQGPRAPELVAGLFPEAADLPYMHLATTYRGAPARVCRTGYTGERGFELLVPGEVAPALWEELFERGAPLEVVPVGLGGRDTLRLEMGYALHGNDISTDTDPFEARLGWAVAMGKDFRGREALAARKEAGPKRLLVGLVSGDRLIPRHGMAARRRPPGRRGDQRHLLAHPAPGHRPGLRPARRRRQGHRAPGRRARQARRRHRDPPPVRGFLQVGVATETVPELVVLLDGRAAGRDHAQGRGPRARHPLHLAFSVYLFDSGGHFLATRRAWARTWPGCGPTPAAATRPGRGPGRRRPAAVGAELGLRPDRLELVLPAFAYRAVAADGIVENELCPVFVAHLDGDPEPAPPPTWPRWPSGAGVLAGVLGRRRHRPWALSPWAVEQVAQLLRSGRLRNLGGGVGVELVALDGLGDLVAVDVAGQGELLEDAHGDVLGVEVAARPGVSERPNPSVPRTCRAAAPSGRSGRGPASSSR